LQDYYNNIINLSSGIFFGGFKLVKPLALWINDALMAVYFLLIGLEIKREFKRGVLTSSSAIKIPCVAAFFGLAIPGFIYVALNAGHPEYLKGFAIPTATDIAFTLSVVLLLGSRVPFSIRILLTSIAIFDDIAAIIIIACFYTTKLSPLSFLSAFCIIVGLVLLNKFKVRKASVYIFMGSLLWLAVLKSGVHATLSGVVLAMTIPDEQTDSTLNFLEKALHPWVIFLILPLFAFVNSGVSIADMSIEHLFHPVFLGVLFGLVFGKQIGVFLPLLYFYKKGGEFASNVTLRHLYGIALLCGMGFTMSFFINALAFKAIDLELLNIAKSAILLGTFISGVLGYCVLRKSKGVF
jgi:NhaA family Na+:H+ antiporter